MQQTLHPSLAASLVPPVHAPRDNRFYVKEVQLKGYTERPLRPLSEEVYSAELQSNIGSTCIDFTCKLVHQNILPRLCYITAIIIFATWRSQGLIRVTKLDLGQVHRPEDQDFESDLSRSSFVHVSSLQTPGESKYECSYWYKVQVFV